MSSSRRGHALEAAGHAGELRETALDRVERHVERRRHADRRRGCCRRSGGPRAATARARCPRGVRASNSRPSNENESGPGVTSAAWLTAYVTGAGDASAIARAARIVGVDHRGRVARAASRTAGASRRSSPPCSTWKSRWSRVRLVKTAAAKLNAVGAAQRQRVRRHFHHARAASGGHHLAHHPLQFRRLGRRPRRRELTASPIR